MVIAKPQTIFRPSNDVALPGAARFAAPATVRGAYGQRHAQPFALPVVRGRRGEREALLQAFGLVHIPFIDCGLRPRLVADCGFVDRDAVAVSGNPARCDGGDLFAVTEARESPP